jgi:hypothetical protein
MITGIILFCLIFGEAIGDWLNEKRQEKDPDYF